MTLKRLLFASTLSLAVAAVAGSTHAAYSVRVSAESRGQINYGRGYNAGNYLDGEPGGPGFTSYGGNACTPGQYLSCTEGGSGTTDSSPDLKAATESTSYDETSLPNPEYYPQGLHAAGSAYATASLAGGSVGIAASGTYGLSGCCSGQDGGTGTSSAEDIDLLHFNVAGAGPGTMTIIGLSFHVHGGMDAFTPAGDSHGGLTSVFELGGGFFEGSVYSGPNAYTPTFSEAGQTGGRLTDSVTQNAPGDFTFNATYGLTGASQDLGIAEYLEAGCGDGTACDYAHTGTVAFTLPSNVTFTSDSGVFLTQGVPEPATWAMMLIGVGGLGAVLRQRRELASARGLAPVRT
jgi:hypothetical protein